jgi:hypothetical protein
MQLEIDFRIPRFRLSTFRYVATEMTLKAVSEMLPDVVFPLTKYLRTMQQQICPFVGISSDT